MRRCLASLAFGVTLTAATGALAQTVLDSPSDNGRAKNLPKRKRAISFRRRTGYLLGVRLTMFTRWWSARVRARARA